MLTSIQHPRRLPACAAIPGQARAATAAPPDQVTLSSKADAPPLVDVERVKNLFLELTQIPGGTGDERKVADNILQKLTAMGYSAKEDDAGQTIGGNTGNLIVNVPGTVTDAPALIFTAHMDTVERAVGGHPVVKDDGVIYSDGKHALGGDDRAGCAEILEALRIVKENNLPHPPLQLIFCVGEEGGLLGSQALHREDVHGNLGFTVDSFHPQDLFFGWDGNPLFTGGKGNVSANKEKAQAAFQRPARPGEALHPRTSGDSFILDFTRQGIRGIGLEPNERNLFDASSDAASLRELGVPAITIGAGEQDIHSRKEHIAIADIGKSTELILQLIKQANDYQVDANGVISKRGS